MKQTGKPIWNSTAYCSVKHGIGQAHALVCRLFLLPVRLYQRYLSPLKGQGSCRFTPTCSQYCIDAIMEWGVLIGLILTLWRILRCNPFGKGGYDPVPKRKNKR